MIKNIDRSIDNFREVGAEVPGDVLIVRKVLVNMANPEAKEDPGLRDEFNRVLDNEPLSVEQITSYSRKTKPAPKPAPAAPSGKFTSPAPLDNANKKPLSFEDEMREIDKKYPKH
jgi:hypothetical protein